MDLRKSLTMWTKCFEVGDAGLSAGLAAGAAGLESQLLAPGLEGGGSFLGPSGQVDVHGRPHASAQVGGAGVEVAQAGVQQELLAGLGPDGVADGLDAASETVEDATDVTALLHGNDTKLILLVDPGEEGLGGIVEDATALGPVALHSGGDQVFVAGHEKEVVVDQLQSVLLVHAQEGEVLAGQLPGELSKCTLHQSLDGRPLLLGDSGGQAESVNAAADTDPGRVDWRLGVNVALDLADVHVRGVAESGGQAVVLGNDGVEDVGEHDVGVLVAGVDAAVLVVELDGAGDGLSKGESSGGCLETTQLGPFGFCDMLGNQAVCRPDVGEGRSRRFFSRN